MPKSVSTDKACFAHDAAYSGSKDLTKKTNKISDKILKGRSYEIAINPKYNANQSGLTSMFHKLFDRKTKLAAKASVNEELAQKLHKPVIKNSKEEKFISHLKIIFGHYI